MKELAVIIVNYNGQEYLDECLSSFTIQSYKDFDILLVDNNSSDDSLEIAEKFPVKIIKNKENFGFAKGNNIAIQKALKEGYKYVALINPDTVLEQKMLEILVAKAKEDKKIGAVQPLILIYNTNLINTAGNDIHFLGFSYCGDYKEPKNNLKHPKKIVGASGAGVVYQAEALKKTGLLDENFFMYLEDTDLSWRLLENGYELWTEPAAILYHKYNFSRNRNKYYYIERNRLMFILKNYELKTILLLLPALIITEVLMLFYALFSGWLTLKLKGYTDILKSAKKIKANRQKIQKQRLKKDHELKEYWKQNLIFEEVKNPLFRPLNLFFRIYWFFIRIFI